MSDSPAASEAAPLLSELASAGKDAAPPPPARRSKKSAPPISGNALAGQAAEPLSPAEDAPAQSGKSRRSPSRGGGRAAARAKPGRGKAEAPPAGQGSGPGATPAQAPAGAVAEPGLGPRPYETAKTDGADESHQNASIQSDKAAAAPSPVKRKLRSPSRGGGRSAGTRAKPGRSEAEGIPGGQRSVGPEAAQAQAPAEALAELDMPARPYEPDAPYKPDGADEANQDALIQSDEAAAAPPPAKRNRRGSSRGGRRTAAARAKSGRSDTESQEKTEAQATPAKGDLPALRAENLPAPAPEHLPALHYEHMPAVLAQPEQPPQASEEAKKQTDKRRGRAAASVAQAEAAPEEKAGRRKMFVSVLAGEQVEVAVAEEGTLREYYVEMLHQAKAKGNIYKGTIHNIDPNLQAAFISYGAARNGFLQIDEVHPEYYAAGHEAAGKGYKYPLIQKVLKAGQEILVQVVKEASGSKGAFLTTYLSLPGRYLVLTPGREQIGVSRKVGNEAERGRLRETLDALEPGPGLGVIVRTASEGAGKTNLQRDLRFLKRLWQDVRKKGSSETAPALIYQELGLAARAARDYLTEDIAEIWIDDEAIAAQMREVIALQFPKRPALLQLHNDSSQGLFERFGLAKQIRQVQSREVVLPSGGRLVFDHTEALTAIDINSGRSGGKNNFEDMAYKINMEAARHIPLQLRLRDIGGQVVVDFIEMRDRSHWREVEKTFRTGMKEDRARHDVGKISSFGLLEVVRQRLGSSAISVASEPCPCCRGTGIRRNMEWQSMQALQEIRQLIRQNSGSDSPLVYSAANELILYLLNSKRERLLEMEQEAGVRLELRPGL